MEYRRNIQWGMIVLLSVLIVLINVSEAEISGSLAYIYDTDVTDAKSFTGYPDSMTSDGTAFFIYVLDYNTSDLSFIPVQTPSPPVHHPTLNPHFNFQLNLSSVTQCADIFIDDVYVGKNPKKITITEQSTHTLQLDLKGYEEERFFQFDVGKGEKVIETILQEPFGPVKTPTPVPPPTMVPTAVPKLSPHFVLNLSSVPQGADIFIDDALVGKTPKKIIITDLATHTLRLDLKGYEEEERFFQFDVGEGEKVIEIILQTHLTPQPTMAPHFDCMIEVTTNITSNFTITGPVTYQGSGTFRSISNVPAGTYTITYEIQNHWIPPPPETKTVSSGEVLAFHGNYRPGSLKTVNNSSKIDKGDGYVIFVKNISHRSDEVSIELQLDDRIIDERILKKWDYYKYTKYYGENISFQIIDIYQDMNNNIYAVFAYDIVKSLHAHPKLNIASDPQGAEIWVDEIYVGKTPKQIPILDLEKHTLFLVLEGYEDAKETFEFRQNETNEMMVNMNKIQTTPTSTTPVPTSTTPVPTSTTLIPTSITPVPTFAKPTAIPTSPQVPGFIAKTFLLTILCGYLLVIILRR